MPSLDKFLKRRVSDSSGSLSGVDDDDDDEVTLVPSRSRERAKPSSHTHQSFQPLAFVSPGNSHKTQLCGAQVSSPSCPNTPTGCGISKSSNPQITRNPRHHRPSPSTPQLSTWGIPIKLKSLLRGQYSVREFHNLSISRKQKVKVHRGVSAVCSPRSSPSPDATKLNLVLQSRSPLASIVQPDGVFAPYLLLIFEAQSYPVVPCYWRSVRIKLLDCLAETLAQVVSPGDSCSLEHVPSLLNVVEVPSSQLELQLGANVESCSFGSFPTNQWKEPYTILKVQRPSSDHAFVCGVRENNPLLYIESPTPPWASGAESTAYFRQKVWPRLPSKSRYEYIPLSLLQANMEAFFFGCILDVSRTIRFLNLPRYGRVAAMNIDLADPSIATTFRASMHSSIRVSLLLIAGSPDAMPIVSPGDVVRVHRSQMSIHQDLKNNAMYINASNLCGVTSIRCWRLDDSKVLDCIKNLRDSKQAEAKADSQKQVSLSQIHASSGLEGDGLATEHTSDAVSEKESAQIGGGEALNSVRRKNGTSKSAAVFRSIIETRNKKARLLQQQQRHDTQPEYRNPVQFQDLVECYWKSSKPKSGGPQTPFQWVEERSQSVDHWQTLYALMAWTFHCIYNYRSFMSSYYSPLGRLYMCESGKFTDVIVQVKMIETVSFPYHQISTSHDTYSSEMPSTQSQPMYTSQLTDSGNLRSELPSEGPGSFRLHVVDSSWADDQGIWLLTNFPACSAAHLGFHLKQGNWIRAKNVMYTGVKRLCRPSLFLADNQPEKDVYVLDGSRARVTLMPSYASEIMMQTVQEADVA